jgi:hypothetical protein
MLIASPSSYHPTKVTSPLRVTPSSLNAIIIPPIPTPLSFLTFAPVITSSLFNLSFGSPQKDLSQLDISSYPTSLTSSQKTMLVTHSAQAGLPRLLKLESLLQPSKPWAVGLLLPFRFIFCPSSCSSFRLSCSSTFTLIFTYFFLSHPIIPHPYLYFPFTLPY